MALHLLAGAGSAAEPAPWPTREWPRASAAEAGLDPEALAALVHDLQTAESVPDLHSLLVVRHGYLVVEEYLDGWEPDDLHTLQSVTKSFTSALVGIAVARNELGVEDRVLGFFPGVEVAHLDDHKRALRIEDLLTMRTGTDYWEGAPDSPHGQLNRRARGWDRFYLDRPMIAPPGTRFRYDSGGVILLSSLLRRRTGLHADAYAARHLFAPLGITRWEWETNAEGHPHTGGGLDLRPRDVAKLGLLYLRDGWWDGRQVVPAEWVRRSTRTHVRFERPGRWTVGYGYLWWIGAPDPEGEGEIPIVSARGLGGQYLFVVPEHDLLVVVTAWTRGRGEEEPVVLLYERILPAIVRSERRSG